MSKQIHKAYKFRLYPNDEQKVFFAKSFGCTRFIWNEMLADKKEHYLATKTSLKNTPAQYKKEFEWLREVDSLALANAQMQLNQAFSHFFRRLKEPPKFKADGTRDYGFPNFKHKGKRDSYTTNNQKGTVAIDGSFIKLPKIGHIKANIHRSINGLIKSATVSRTPTGKYFVSLLVETIAKPFPKTNSNIGIDLGLTDFIVLSDGTRVANPKFLAKLQDKLSFEQRKLSKRREVSLKAKKKLSDSRNYQKQRLKVNKIHETISNKRKDFLHKLSHSLIKNHDVIVIEDLNVKGMVKNHKLAKSISDSSWSTFTTMLSYKADWYGKEVIKVDRWFPSSKTCSGCSHVLTKAELPLSLRSWRCPSCEQDNDRDINASINILNEGLRLVKQSKTVGATGLA